jgi:hypothetical protein
MEVPPPTKSVATEVPTSDPPAFPPRNTIPDSDNFVDLRDDDEEEEDEGPVVFRRKRKTVEDDAGDDAEAQAKRAEKGKSNDEICILPLSFLGVSLSRLY